MRELSEDADLTASDLTGGSYQVDLESHWLQAPSSKTWYEDDLVRVARGALELVGAEVKFSDREYKDSDQRTWREREYLIGYVPFLSIKKAPTGVVTTHASYFFNVTNHAAHALTLLHAARTAREWASEGGEL